MHYESYFQLRNIGNPGVSTVDFAPELGHGLKPW